MATANGRLIVRYQALAGLFQRLRMARARVKKFSEGSEFADPRRRKRAAAALDSIERSVDKINAAYGQKWSGDCVGAFVVFSECALGWLSLAVSGQASPNRLYVKTMKSRDGAAWTTTGDFPPSRLRPCASGASIPSKSTLHPTLASECGFWRSWLLHVSPLSHAFNMLSQGGVGKPRALRVFAMAAPSARQHACAHSPRRVNSCHYCRTVPGGAIFPQRLNVADVRNNAPCYRLQRFHCPRWLHRTRGPVSNRYVDS